MYKNFVEFWKDRDLKGSSHDVALEAWGAGVKCGKATNVSTAIIKAVEDIKEQIQEECYYGAREACIDLIEELEK